MPERWDVRSIEVRDGAVWIETAESGSFRVTEESAQGLFFLLTPGVASRPDYMLQVIWVENAGVEA